MAGDLTTAQRVADDAVPAVRRAYQFALARAVAAVDLGQLADAIRHRQAGAVVAVVRWDRLERELLHAMAPAFLDVMEEAALAHLKELPFPTAKRNPIDVHGQFRFDKTNPQARIAAEGQAYDLIREVDSNSRAAIRSLIMRLFDEQGETVESIARKIRAVIGLTERQALALERFAASLDAALSDIQQAKLIDTYRRRALANRAQTIARTETMRASNAGQTELWRQAQAAGYLPPGQLRQWLVTPDERLCPICKPIPENGPVPLGQPFTGGDGGSYLQPPAHPNCRCAMSLVFAQEPAAA